MLSLDDLNFLVLGEPQRANIFSEYSLSILTETKSVNCNEIAKLIKYISSSLKMIRDEKTRLRVQELMKHLYKAFESNMAFSPVDFCRKYSARDFSNQCYGIISFNEIAIFMTEIFKDFKSAEKTGSVDSPVLFLIFNEVKETCKNLGIKTADLKTLYNAYMNPEPDLWGRFHIDVQINDENSIPNDIEIGEIPYFVKLPLFEKDGRIIGMLDFPINYAPCYYNVRKYNELVGAQGLK